MHSFYFESCPPSKTSGVRTLELDEVITQLSEPEIDNIQVLWSSLIQGLVEHKIDSVSEDPLNLERIQTATEMARRELTHGPSPASREFLDTLQSDDNFARRVITTSNTFYFHNAIKPSVCANTANRIDRRFPEGEKPDQLVIALGHSGVLPAIQTTIYYDELNNTHSDIYPVRFSRGRLNDRLPQLDDDEMQYLASAAEDKEVTVFDDTVASAETIRGAILHFQTALGRRSIHPGWCVDLRESYTMSNPRRPSVEIPNE